MSNICGQCFIEFPTKAELNEHIDDHITESEQRKKARATRTKKDAAIGKSLRHLVLNRGSNPGYHESEIRKLEFEWPLLHSLIRKVQNDELG